MADCFKVLCIGQLLSIPLTVFFFFFFFLQYATFIKIGRTTKESPNNTFKVIKTETDSYPKVLN